MILHHGLDGGQEDTQGELGLQRSPLLFNQSCMGLFVHLGFQANLHLKNQLHPPLCPLVYQVRIFLCNIYLGAELLEYRVEYTCHLTKYCQIALQNGARVHTAISNV